MVLSMISLVTVSLLMDWLFKERPLFHSINSRISLLEKLTENRADNHKLEHGKIFLKMIGLTR
jgi:hypothetical protein